MGGGRNPLFARGYARAGHSTTLSRMLASARRGGSLCEPLAAAIAEAGLGDFRAGRAAVGTERGDGGSAVDAVLPVLLNGLAAHGTLFARYRHGMLLPGFFAGTRRLALADVVGGGGDFDDEAVTEAR